MSAVRYLLPGDISELLRLSLHWKTLPLSKRFAQHPKHEVKRIGICVSGGPDSMALAYLLHHMKHPYDSSMKAFESHAFIVDHGMRSESKEEANRVQQNLAMLGVSASIINVAAVERLGSTKVLQSFKSHKTETNARIFRYQAMIMAARQNGMHELFLGHHHDDQMETLIMKMITQRSFRLSSFRGMSVISSAPYTLQSFDSRKNLEGNANSPYAHDGFDERSIKLVRPLLEFPKARLLATCEHFKIPFVLDQTNLDPSYTLRNAIRHLRSHTKLPRALQDTSLTKLRNRAIEDADLEEHAGGEFNDTIIAKEVYKESGMTEVTFGELTQERLERYLRGAGFTLARFCDLVSPINKDLIPSRLSSLATKAILSLLDIQQPTNSVRGLGRELHHQTLQVDFRATHPRHCTCDKGLKSLQISRQPMRRSEILANTFNINVHSLAEDDAKNSQWISWDNRFWIRVKPITSSRHGHLNLVLRPYQPQDVPRTRKLMQSIDQQTSIEERLNTCAPGHVRYTLPVFALDGEVVAFPTCDIQLAKQLPFSWQVAYSRPQRAIDFFESRS